MGITVKKLKSGNVWLAQKRVNGQRESKTFTELIDAENWLSVKTQENDLALAHPVLYEVALKKLDNAVANKRPFRDEYDYLEMFRSCPDKLKDREFMLMFNAVADYERKPVLLARYKEIIARLRKESHELS